MADDSLPAAHRRSSHHHAGQAPAGTDRDACAAERRHPARAIRATALGVAIASAVASHAFLLHQDGDFQPHSPTDVRAVGLLIISAVCWTVFITVVGLAWAAGTGDRSEEPARLTPATRRRHLRHHVIAHIIVTSCVATFLIIHQHYRGGFYTYSMWPTPLLAPLDVAVAFGLSAYPLRCYLSTRWPLGHR